MHNHNHNDDKLNAGSCVWGVETAEGYSPKDVREAMVNCFVSANGDMIAQMAGEELPDDETARQQKIKELTAGFVRKAFAETGGDYDNPDKASIIRVLEQLKKFAKKMNHDQAMIDRHVADITKLADKLP